ncbi:nucleoid-associated protein [Pseudomonas psychrophila]|uniref:Nucleoid-associated protein n=1 Tax=Pseudomonas psychrophila TaxID=122355 RepID=A0A8I1FYL7_9PSED|nr:nucleoid-associated protein [Pseudomonas psychrophila]
MPIKSCVIHSIDKKPDGNPAVLHLRDTELPQTDVLENLLHDFNDAYNGKQSKGWGLFHGESGAYPFSGWLKTYLEGKSDFMEFSRHAVEHLTRLMFWHLENVKYLCYAIQTFRSSGASKAA